MKPRREPGRPAFNADKVDPRDLGLALSQLPHDHELVVAARLALEVRAERMPSYEDYPGGRYHRIHELPEHTETDLRRYPPTGDRDEWVKERDTDWKGLAAQIPEQRPTEWIPAATPEDAAAHVRTR